MKWDVKIEKSIPLPHSWPDILKKMEVGDSFLLPTSKPGGTGTNIYTYAKKLGMTMKSRKVNGGVRFWRVK
jgi:hypothetical protein